MLPSLAQLEFKVLIDTVNAAMNNAQDAMFFLVNILVFNGYTANDYVKSIKKPKSDVVTVKINFEKLPDPQTLGAKNLVCVDDCAILNQDQVLK